MTYEKNHAGRLAANAVLGAGLDAAGETDDDVDDVDPAIDVPATGADVVAASTAATGFDGAET